MRNVNFAIRTAIQVCILILFLVCRHHVTKANQVRLNEVEQILPQLIQISTDVFDQGINTEPDQFQTAAELSLQFGRFLAILPDLGQHWRSFGDLLRHGNVTKSLFNKIRSALINGYKFARGNEPNSDFSVEAKRHIKISPSALDVYNAYLQKLEKITEVFQYNLFFKYKSNLNEVAIKFLAKYNTLSGPMDDLTHPIDWAQKTLLFLTSPADNATKDANTSKLPHILSSSRTSSAGVGKSHLKKQLKQLAVVFDLPVNGVWQRNNTAIYVLFQEYSLTLLHKLLFAIQINEIVQGIRGDQPSEQSPDIYAYQHLAWDYVDYVMKWSKQIRKIQYLSRKCDGI